MITFRRLEVSNFRGIESATVDFTPRLNILYGTNELGKSTLLAAMRAVLLLPMTAKEAQAYVTWGTKHIPAVTLDFAVNDTEYRVHKQFATGSRGVSELYRMKGREKFRQASQRNVDKELRKLIAWGMPEPGARGAPRGLPQSYLSNALLGYQDEVEAILNTDINDDRSDSGEQALTNALGTIGQDPLVSEFLEDLDARTSRVYTPTGQEKRTLDSPLVIKTRDTSNAETQLRQLEVSLNESREVEASLETLRKTASEHAQEKKRLQKLVELAGNAAAAYSLLNRSEDKQAEVDSVRKQYKDQQAALESLQLEYSKADEAVKAAQQELSTSDTNLARLQQEYKNIDQLTASDSQARRSTMAAEKTEIENRIKDIQATMKLTSDEQELTRQAEEAKEKCEAARKAMEQAEQQLRLAQLVDKRQALQNEVGELEEARKNSQVLQSTVTTTVDKLDGLKQLLAQGEQLKQLRHDLEQAISNDSTLSQTRHMRQEALKKYDDTAQQTQVVTLEIRGLQDQQQKYREQLANLDGQKKSLIDSSATVLHTKRQLLQNEITTSRQQVEVAESAIRLQHDIQQQRHHIDEIKQGLAASHRSLDDAVNNLKHGGPRQYGAPSEPARRAIRDEGRTRSIPVVTLGLTIAATVALLAAWLIDLLPVGLLAAPVATVIGFGFAFFQWTNGRKSKSALSQFERRPPEFGDRFSEVRDQFGNRTDELKREGDRLANAESDLSYLRERHDTLLAQLGSDASSVLQREQLRLQESTVKLTELDARHGQEIEALDREMLQLEQEIKTLGQSIETLEVQHTRLAADSNAAQLDLANHDARIEQAIRGHNVETGDIEFQLLELASVVRKQSGIALDHSSVASIEGYLAEQQKLADILEQQLHNQRDSQATAKSDVKHREGNEPVSKLESLNAEISELSRDQPLVEQSLSDATDALNTLKHKLDTALSNLSRIEGQLQSRRNDISSSAVRENESGESALAALQQQLADKMDALANDTQNSSLNKDQLEKNIEDMESTCAAFRNALDAHKQKADELSFEVSAMQEKAGQSKGKLDELKAQVDEKAKQDAQATIDEAISSSDGMLKRNTPIPQQLESLTARYNEANTQARNSNKVLNQSRGKLELIGGSVLSDQVRRQSETVQRLRREATEFQRNCEAEKHLRDVLSEHNEEHSAHLGRVLAPSVSKQFGELTGSRYGGFSLAPTLQAKGVRANGGEREYSDLSIGTRQQLAVLVRLSLAAQLQASLVLDDQLVQSDATRLAWFRDALRRSAHDSNHQIIVITCRPADYSAPFESGDLDSSIDLKHHLKSVVLS